jgi:hypothetical protein
MADPSRAANRLRRAIAAGGGIATQAELARHWGVNRARARQLAGEPGFPAPVATIGGSDVWAVGEVDAWRAERFGPGRPPVRAAVNRAYLPGELVPVTGQWTRYDVASGTSTGRSFALERGEHFPPAGEGQGYSLAPVGGTPAVRAPTPRRR